MDDFKLKILPLLINGHYTDWFFNVLLSQLFMFLRNNIEVLLLFALAWQRIAKITKTTWDDKVADWLVNFLSKWNKPKIIIKGEKENEQSKIFDDNKYR